MTLTVDKIVDKLVSENRLQRREATDLVETFIEHLRVGVEEGKRVTLPAFGSFWLKKQPYQRKRRDIPVDVETPVWKTPSFSSSAKLRARIQYATVAESRDVD